MARKRNRPEQIVAKLRETDAIQAAGGSGAAALRPRLGSAHEPDVAVALRERPADDRRAQSAETGMAVR